MTALPSIFNHVGPFMLTLFRLSGLFVFAPVLASAVIPVRARVLLVVMFTAALYPTLPPVQQVPIHMDILSLAPAVFSEAMIGVTIGLISALPLYAVQLGGQAMGQQAGIALGQVFNPALDIESDALSQLLLEMALAAYVALGGLEVMFIALASTFSRIPLGQAGAVMVHAPLQLFTNLLTSGFELAIRVSAPVMCILFIETLATGILSRTAGQLNILSYSYGIKVLLTFLVLIAGIAAIDHATSDEIERTNTSILMWVENLVLPPTTAGISG